MKTLIVANWKCNPTTLAEAKLLFNSIKRGAANFKNKNIETVICPPFPYLSTINSSNQKPKIKLGSQNVFWQEKGAFTGEVSPLMLKDLGAEYVIVGHSERRALGETDIMINKKIKAAIGAKLKPILCIGETKKQRKEGKTFEVLKNQLQKDLEGIENCKLKIENLIVAYEPIFAIGTGNPCSVEKAKEVRKKIKHSFVLYGGSVNSQNAEDYIKKAGFQGLLVGGASLDAREFIRIVKNVNS